jgi:hypothetical protein
MDNTIYLKDGTMECIFDPDDEPKVLYNLIYNALGKDVADRCKYYFDGAYTTGDEEADMIIDDLSNALRDIQDHVSGLKNVLEAKRLSRKDINYHIRHIQNILDNNL